MQLASIYAPKKQELDSKLKEQLDKPLKMLEVKPKEDKLQIFYGIVKNNKLTQATFDLYYNQYVSANAVSMGLKALNPGQSLDEIKNTKKAAKNNLVVLYTLINMKPKDREQLISKVRKVQETDPYSDMPGELDITVGHIDSAVLYSAKDILFPKKETKSKGPVKKVTKA